MFIRQSAGVALLLASLPIGAVAQTTKVFIDQDTSGPGGTDAISIAMLLKAPNIEAVGIGVVAGGVRAGVGLGGARARQAVLPPEKHPGVVGQAGLPRGGG